MLTLENKIDALKQKSTGFTRRSYFRVTFRPTTEEDLLLLYNVMETVDWNFIDLNTNIRLKFAEFINIPVKPRLFSDNCHIVLKEIGSIMTFAK